MLPLVAVDLGLIFNTPCGHVSPARSDPLSTEPEINPEHSQMWLISQRKFEK